MANLENVIAKKVTELHELKTLRFQIGEAHNLYEIIEGLWGTDMADELADKIELLEGCIDQTEEELQELDKEAE